MSEVQGIEKSWFDSSEITEEMREMMGESMNGHMEEELRVRKQTMRVLEDSIKLKEDLKNKIIIDKPEIPQFIADFIEYSEDEIPLFVAVERMIITPSYKRVYYWYLNHPDEFNIAWMYGYNVVKEDKYMVICALPNTKDGKVILKRDIRDSSLRVMPLVGPLDDTDVNYHFTEEEIRELAPGFINNKVLVEDYQ